MSSSRISKFIRLIIFRCITVYTYLFYPVSPEGSRRMRAHARSRRRVINIYTQHAEVKSEPSRMKLSAEHSDRMMAQHVVRSRFAPATILLLLVPACVVQLANVNAAPTLTSTSTSTIDGVVQPEVKSAPVIRSAIALSALPFGAADDRRPLVEFLGAGLGRELALRWSPSSDDCPTYSDDALLDAVWTSSARDRAIYEFRTIPVNPKSVGAVVYFCLRNASDDNGGDGRRWGNLGDRVSIKIPVRPE